MGSVAIPGFGGLGWVWEAVCSDSWVWRRFEERLLGDVSEAAKTQHAVEHSLTRSLRLA